jgi:hypothetical protein
MGRFARFHRESPRLLHSAKEMIANNISYDGRTIVGYGTNPNGFTEARVARFDYPVPEPSTAALLLTSAAPLWFALRRYRQRQRRAAFAR